MCFLWRFHTYPGPLRWHFLSQRCVLCVAHPLVLLRAQSMQFSSKPLEKSFGFCVAFKKNDSRSQGLIYILFFGRNNINGVVLSYKVFFCLIFIIWLNGKDGLLLVMCLSLLKFSEVFAWNAEGQKCFRLEGTERGDSTMAILPFETPERETRFLQTIVRIMRKLVSNLFLC